MSGGVMVDASLGLTSTQLEWARRIVARIQARGFGADGPRIADIALATAIVESALYMYANRGNPESLRLPHDRVGSDHDSVGLFQQRPSMGWGTTRELMNAETSTDRFVDALRRLDWKPMTNGQAAQRVQVSAFPDRYAQQDARAQRIREALWTGETMLWPNGTKTRPTISSAFNPNRRHPKTGVWQPHRGTDFIGFSDVKAVTAGTVTVAGNSGGTGGWWVHIDHGGGVTSRYLHLRANSIVVRVGQRVSAGQKVGVMGATDGGTKTVTGVHLHFEIRLTGTAVDPVPYIEARLGGTAGGGGTPIEEEDMPLTDADVQKIANAVWAKQLNGQTAGRRLQTQAANSARAVWNYVWNGELMGRRLARQASNSAKAVWDYIFNPYRDDLHWGVPQETAGQRLRRIVTRAGRGIGETEHARAEIAGLRALVAELADRQGVDAAPLLASVTSTALSELTEPEDDDLNVPADGVQPEEPETGGALAPEDVAEETTEG